MTPSGSPQRQQAGAHLRRGARRPRPEPPAETEQDDLFTTTDPNATQEEAS